MSAMTVRDAPSAASEAAPASTTGDSSSPLSYNANEPSLTCGMTYEELVNSVGAELQRELTDGGDRRGGVRAGPGTPSLSRRLSSSGLSLRSRISRQSDRGRRRQCLSPTPRRNLSPTPRRRSLERVRADLSISYIQGASSTRSPLRQYIPRTRSLSRSPIRSPLQSLSPNNRRRRDPSFGARTKETVSYTKPSPRRHATPCSQKKAIKKLKAFSMAMEEVAVLNVSKTTESHSLSVPTPTGESSSLQNECDSSFSATKEHRFSDTMGKENEAESRVEKNHQPQPRINFIFPRNISCLGPKLLQAWHAEAVSNSEFSHQRELDWAGTGLLSFHEVILPAIGNQTGEALKKMQGKAQRAVKNGKPDEEGKNVVEIIKACRQLVVKGTGGAMQEVGVTRRERVREAEELLERLEKEERKRESLKRSEARKARREARAEAVRAREEERARARDARRVRLKREQTKNHPKNKELWREVAVLMGDVQRLEKEERAWNKALWKIEATDQQLQQQQRQKSPQKNNSTSKVEVKGKNYLSSKENEYGGGPKDEQELEYAAENIVKDVTLASERINMMLLRVTEAMKESENVRKELYQKYNHDHQFHGYPMYGDPKGVFLALSMDD